VALALHARQWLSQPASPAEAIKRLHDRLAAAVDAAGKPDAVLRAFALHLHEHLLLPSGRGGSHSRAGAWTLPGCSIYVPPKGILWEVPSPKSEFGVRGANDEERSPKSEVEVQGPDFKPRFPPAAVGYLSRFLCAAFALALLATACAGPRPLKGGRAVTTRKPAGLVEQTVVQGENPAQATKQSQESVKLRTYTLAAGSRMEQSQMPTAAPTLLSTINSQPINFRRAPPQRAGRAVLSGVCAVRAD
jgi:hypothetical protein